MQDKVSYTTIDNSEEINRAVSSYNAVARTTYKDHETNISVREGFSRFDYEYFRPGEYVPTKHQEIIKFGMDVYRKVGLVRNIIDLMADFAVQGIKISHPSKSHQKFYRSWARKVKFSEVSERFANLLLRTGNVAIKRGVAKITNKQTKLFRSQGDTLENDYEIPSELKTRKKNIPFSYSFLNPTNLEVIGGELAQFTGKRAIALKISHTLRRKILSPKNQIEKDLVAELPDFILNAVKNGSNIIPLDMNKIKIYHYKKDDWDEWADPLTYAIYDDLVLLDKMKLADLSALDGAISQVRLWKLGDIDKGIFPTDAAINKLSEILLSNPGGGAFDIIWGPDLTLESYKTDVHQFLGDAKYIPVLNSIYGGLGVPPTLTGSSTASGATNNFISLKTLVQRLEYVRQQLCAFWEEELELVRKAMGFSKSAKVQFDRLTLTDEAAEKALLIQLWDRRVISDEILVERIGEIPELEEMRIQRENREREEGKRDSLYGPYFPGDKLHEYTRVALGRGYIDPRDTGLDIEYEPTPFDKQLQKVSGATQNKGGNKGVSGQGRPKNSKDGPEGRKQREFKVRTSASTIDNVSSFITASVWAKHAQSEIAEILNPIILKLHNKNSMRALSSKQFNDYEDVKFIVLSNLNPYEEITQERIYEILENKIPLQNGFSQCYSALASNSYEINGREPNIEERKILQASVYSLMKVEGD